jgi:L-galactose dehydrogenase
LAICILHEEQNMEYGTLGRTGLRVSVFGLGAGGHSRLGMQTGATEAESVALVRRAAELGVTFFDTAEAYGTEELIGKGLHELPRGDLVVSTKKSIVKDGQLIAPETLVQGLEASLRRLQTDYVDVYHLHGVRAEHYEQAREALLPALHRLREQGKLRFIGITEAFGFDTSHAMLTRALRDDDWDVIMVGFNILNQSARERVLAETRRRNIGTLCMFAVRAALSQPDKLRETVAELVRQGHTQAGELDPRDPLGWLRESASSIPEAAYRFCRMEPGLDVILSGTGNMRHLEENIESVLRPPLPAEIHQRLVELFAGVDSVSGQ